MDLADDAAAIEIARVELAGGHCAPVIALASPRPGDLRAVGKMFSGLRAFADAVVKPIEGQIEMSLDVGPDGREQGALVRFQFDKAQSR